MPRLNQNRVASAITYDVLYRKYRPVVILSTHGSRQNECCWEFLAGLGYVMALRRDGSEDGKYEVLALPAELSGLSRERPAAS